MGSGGWCLLSVMVEEKTGVLFLFLFINLPYFSLPPFLSVLLHLWVGPGKVGCILVSILFVSLSIFNFLWI